MRIIRFSTRFMTPTNTAMLELAGTMRSQKGPVAWQPVEDPAAADVLFLDIDHPEATVQVTPPRPGIMQVCCTGAERAESDGDTLGKPFRTQALLAFLERLERELSPHDARRPEPGAPPIRTVGSVPLEPSPRPDTAPESPRSPPVQPDAFPPRVLHRLRLVPDAETSVVRLRRNGDTVHIEPESLRFWGDRQHVRAMLTSLPEQVQIEYLVGEAAQPEGRSADARETIAETYLRASMGKPHEAIPTDTSLRLRQWPQTLSLAQDRNTIANLQRLRRGIVLTSLESSTRAQGMLGWERLVATVNACWQLGYLVPETRPNPASPPVRINPATPSLLGRIRRRLGLEAH